MFERSNKNKSRAADVSPKEPELGQGFGGSGDDPVLVLPDGGVEEADVLVVITGFLQR